MVAYAAPYAKPRRHSAATAQPQRSHSTATAQPRRNHSAATAQPQRIHNPATSQLCLCRHSAISPQSCRDLAKCHLGVLPSAPGCQCNPNPNSNPDPNPNPNPSPQLDVPGPLCERHRPRRRPPPSSALRPPGAAAAAAAAAAVACLRLRCTSCATHCSSGGGPRHSARSCCASYRRLHRKL